MSWKDVFPEENRYFETENGKNINIVLKNVLSLFDGISCGRLALDRAGIKYEKYYASEIDKYAVAVARYNYSDTIFVGDIRYLKGGDFKDVDIIIGGSPCQSFSFSGKRQGVITKEKIEVTSLEQYLELKEQRFEFEGQSYLFWEFVRLLKEIKPKWFLLENVKMAEKWVDVITDALGIRPIEINSALVSAQNRVRLYWTNIPVEGLPEDKGILLKDIMESEVDKKYFIEKRLVNIKGKTSLKKVLANLKTPDQKAKCLTARGQSISNSGATNLCLCAGLLDIKGWKQTRRVYDILGKPPTLTTCNGGLRQPKILVNRNESLYINENKIRVRKLTPLECERLQTLPDNYTQYGLFDNGKVKEISDTQRYKMIGNGWTVDVIVWILTKKRIEEVVKQMRLF
jgi:DNA (cytosine-5)-methyltransferase 3A